MIRYPYDLVPLDEGRYMTAFPDVPEALGHGDDLDDAVAWAEDCLLTALTLYTDSRRPVPEPSVPAPGQRVVEVPPLVALKIVLHNAMLAQGVSQVRLASVLRTDPKSVRRLLDLDHKSRLEHLEAALAALGYSVSVDVRHDRPTCFAESARAV